MWEFFKGLWPLEVYVVLSAPAFKFCNFDPTHWFIIYVINIVYCGIMNSVTGFSGPPEAQTHSCVFTSWLARNKYTTLRKHNDQSDGARDVNARGNFYFRDGQVLKILINNHVPLISYLSITTNLPLHLCPFTHRNPPLHATTTW